MTSEGDDDRPRYAGIPADGIPAESIPAKPQTTAGRLDSELQSLPVADCLSDLVAALQQSLPVVLKAPPGAGKTTGVPPAVLRSGIADEGKMLLVQPRRLAARAAAARLANLLDVKLGEEVGYHVRFDKRASRRTRLIAMTTGVLLRRLNSDPLLEDVGCVLLDEFHERSIEVDLALGMLQRIRTTLRPELKLVVMSATLDPQPIVDFLGEAAAINSEGRAYPVSVQYATALSRDPVDQQVAAVLPDLLEATTGHVLIFLPGIGEIRRTRRTIETMAIAADANLLELYGDLPPKQQDRVLAESSRRKIILATNVAETSITIAGVTGVIDSGQARVMRFDPRVGLPKLLREPISQASAEQRTGRAGRTQPGHCYRLWPAVTHRSRRQRDTPEIERTDLSSAVLMLAAWGERDVQAFPWLTPPPEAAVFAAKKLLRRLDAIDDQGAVTRLGRQMLALPLHPRLARFIVEAERLGVQSDAALAAAMLTERDPFRGSSHSGRSSNSAHRVAHARCDVTNRVERLKAFYAGNPSGVENTSAANQIRRVADQILHASKPSESAHSDEPETDRLQHALLAAYPDRLARRRTTDADRGVMVGGRGVRLDSRSQAREGELFLCIDVDSTGSEALVRSASVVEPEWLPTRMMREVDEPMFDASLKAVVARRRKYFDDLVLSEAPVQCTPGPEVGDLLATHAKAEFDGPFPTKDQALCEFVDRVRFLSTHMPELDLPPLDDQAMEEVLHRLCLARTSIAELESAPWLDHLRGRYDYPQQQLIEKHAPQRMTVPSGNAIAIRYAAGKPPVMAVRIQELFGWKETPRVAGGRVALQLHLLGPNHRPQQITEDLASFWSETYANVRKELRRRYSRHHWPEDPFTAKATRNGLKPRS